MMARAYLDMFPPKLVLTTFLVSLIAAGSCECRKDGGKEQPSEPSRPAPSPTTLGPADLQAIADFVRNGSATELPAVLSVASSGVYVAARGDGARIAEAWGHGASAALAFKDAWYSLGPLKEADTLEIFIAMEAQPLLSQSDFGRLRSNIHRGIFGLSIGMGETREMYSPTYVLASNRKLERLVELYGESHALSKDQLDRQPYAFLMGPQLLIPLSSQGPALLMERGNRYIAPGEVTKTSVQIFADQMAAWMWNNTHQDGRMTYLYYPSQGQEAGINRDNLIRQFMASIALGRVATRSKDPALVQRAADNIDYNLRTYYTQEGDMGVVELQGKVKLGALALAALAIVEHPKRSRWASQEAALRHSVQSLWHKDGSFTSFLRPEGRNDNQNFYPGEALLLWASLYSESKDPKLLEQFMASFRYYRAYHLDTSVANRRNPAFVPWHTQAYYMVWLQTRDAELAAFIFEMNDWLLGVQEWDGALYPDTQGRFYDPKRPFGAPHASSTGVYLEGLIDAYKLARAMGDATRAGNYQLAIRRALRSSMQLQFADEIDMFYVHNKDAVRGALRTTVYDNQIRCDNVQHTLMGTLKILDSEVLSDVPPLPN